MKDYSLNKTERYNFILKYEIDHENIILYLASGEKYPIPYNEENEGAVLKKMKSQVRNAYRFECEAGNSIKINIGNIILNIVWISIYASFILLNSPQHLSNVWFLGINALSLVWSAINIAYFKGIKKDIEKAYFFLENAELLNNNIDKSNVLINVSKKTCSKIQEVPEDRCVFDINSIDSMSLEDLKTIKYNIERRNTFVFQEEEKKGKTRVLKPDRE